MGTRNRCEIVVRVVRQVRERDAECAIAQAASVVGDWWSLLIVREVARGRHRFDELHDELGISRKVLTERLQDLVQSAVLVREPYQERPTRYDYRLTAAGMALAPVLISLQDWADQWILGDGAVTGTGAQDGATAHRVHALLGTQVPALALPAVGRGVLDVVDPDAAATVVFAYPATGIPAPLPPGWGDIPGAQGCTLENRLFRQAAPDFAAAGVALRGVSTQRPDEQAAFAAAENITHPLLSDADLRFTAALRLPTFRAGQALRIRRAMLVVDRARTIRHVVFPVLDIPAAVAEVLAVGRAVPQ